MGRQPVGRARTCSALRICRQTASGVSLFSSMPSRVEGSIALAVCACKEAKPRRRSAARQQAGAAALAWEWQAG